MGPEAGTPDTGTSDTGSSDTGIDWLSVLETGAMLGWKTAELMAATLPELMLAMRGWLRARGVDPDGPKKQQAMTMAELHALIEKYG